MLSTINPPLSPLKTDHPEWNGRSWVMEAIELLKPKGWVDSRIESQQSLLPSLKKAAAETVRLMESSDETHKRAIVPFDLVC